MTDDQIQTRVVRYHLAVEPLENPERQERLGKWIPYLWIPPFALIVFLGVFAYCAR